MNLEAQRQAIAKACGWTEIKPQRLTSGLSVYPTGKLHGLRKDGSRDYFVPDYLNDLDAMHEAEKILTLQQISDYAKWLELIVTPLQRTANVVGQIWHASAAQRAEAFLKTLKLWES